MFISLNWGWIGRIVIVALNNSPPKSVKQTSFKSLGRKEFDDDIKKKKSSPNGWLLKNSSYSPKGVIWAWFPYIRFKNSFQSEITIKKLW